MSVVATSVFLLFALIVLGFILGKRNIIHKESIPDLSALVLQVTMPVTVFCSIIDQERSQLVSYGVQTFLFIILLHLCALLVGLILIHAVKVHSAGIVRIWRQRHVFDGSWQCGRKFSDLLCGS